MNQQSRRTRVGLVAVAFGGVSLLIGGCYTRTVESRGIGTRWQTGQTYEPNLKTSDEGGGVLDGVGDLLIGPRKIEERKR